MDPEQHSERDMNDEHDPYYANQEGEEEDDDRDYDDDHSEQELPVFEALGHFDATEPGDLSFAKGDTFRVLATRPDGWWQVENSKRQQGLVPSSYLKIHSRYEEIPSVDKDRSVHTQKIGHIGMYTVKSDVSDALEALGILPRYTTPSTLYKLQRDNPRLSIEYHLLPKLSKSGLGFHDLYWNPERQKLRKRDVRFTRLMKPLRCQNLQYETSGVDVVQRFVRFCLFDGTRILSNVHTIIAQYDRKKPTVWTFLNKLTNNSSCAELSSFFVRSNFTTNDVQLLVELAYGYLTPNKEYGEVSIGWATLPLLNDSGQVQLKQNKVYAVILKRGSPFDSNPTVNSEPPQQEGTLKRLLESNKQPKLIIRISTPPASMQHLLDEHPDTLIWNTIFVPFVVWYRRWAGMVLMRDKLQQDGGTLVGDTFLASFPKAAADMDIMDVLNDLWIEEWKHIDRADKNSEEKLASKFRDFFLDTGFVLLQHALMAYSGQITNPGMSERKRSEFREFIKIYRDLRNPTFWLTTKTSSPLNLRQIFIDLSHVYAD